MSWKTKTESSKICILLILFILYLQRYTPVIRTVEMTLVHLYNYMSSYTPVTVPPIRVTMSLRLGYGEYFQKIRGNRPGTGRCPEDAGGKTRRRWSPPISSEGYNAELYSPDFITTSYDILASETHLMHIVGAPVDNPPMIRGIVRSPESFLYKYPRGHILRSSDGDRPITGRWPEIYSDILRCPDLTSDILRSSVDHRTGAGSSLSRKK